MTDLVTMARPELAIEVYGTPGPQGSKTGFVIKSKNPAARGRVVMKESSDKVKPWRQDVKLAAETAIEGLDWVLLDGPLVVRMVFSFCRPAGHYGSGRNAGVLKASSPLRPAVYPDLSKLVRSTEDALTHTIWRDDSRVVEYERAAKVYVGEDSEALPRPGAWIVVRRLGAPTEGVRYA
jgi:Holliday junction resolvase RusA-like endonuclease